MLAQELKPFKEFTLQWHITDRCLANCKHCYIDKKNRNEIAFDDFKLALDHYLLFLKKYNIKGRVYLTGGDPLLHKFFKSFVDMIRVAGLDFAVLGNYHNLEKDVVGFLKDREIKFFQLSLDGLKQTHDSIRHLGSFDKTIEKIDFLEKAGVITVVNMTVTRKNIDEVVPLIKYLSKTLLTRFDFTRVTPIGNSVADRKSLIKPDRFYALLDDIINVEDKIKKDGHKLSIGKRDHLWKLYYYEHDKLNINFKEMAFGCGMGYRHLTVLPNGDILLCRKIEKVIGNILIEKLTDIYQNSRDVQNIFSKSNIKGCSKCKLYNVCRGCPSIAYAMHGNLNIKDPQCWTK